MKKARIIVREQIIGITSDEGLNALDGIYYSPYEEFDDAMSNSEILKKLVEKHADEYQQLRVADIELVFE